MAEKIRIISISGSEVMYYSPLRRKTMNANLLKARGFNKWFLEFFGFGAMALPGRRIVMLEWLIFDDELLRHELAHVEQYDRYGNTGFLVRYFAMMLRYGYKNHPMEIEARKHERR